MKRIPLVPTLLTVAIMTSAACATNDRVSTTGTITSAAGVSAWREPTPMSYESTTASSVAVDASDAVRASFEWLMLVRIQCGRDPRNCIVDDLAVPGSPIHVGLSDVFDERIRHGIVASARGAHRFRIADVVMIAPDRAEVRSCHTDDVVLVIGGAQGRPTAIYDESLVSHWSTWTMQKTEDRWRWIDESIDRRIHGEDLCQW